jgi:hypothetical protein
MRVPSAVELIGAWERGLAQHPVDRALTLLSAACPELSFAELANLTIGQRDAALLALREALFGRRLDCVALCPRCDTRLEFKLDTAVLAEQARLQSQSEREIEVDGWRLKYRAPNSDDLAAAAGAGDVANARRLLLRRCISAAAGEVPDSAEPWPESVSEAVAEQLARAETIADIILTLQCAACTHGWELAFDIGSFFWSEVSALAKRHLRDVHILAWAYGWSEGDILAMSAARRQFYLDSVS